MFAHQRKKVQLVFAATDALFTIVAFEAAYQTRVHLTLNHAFYFETLTHILLVSFCILVWVALGSFQHVYEYLGAAKPGHVVADTLRQCLFGSVLIVLFEYLLRLDLSRSFLYLFFLYNLALLTVFRWNSRRLISIFERGFGKPYHVLVVGTAARAAALSRQLTAENSPFQVELGPPVAEEECAVRLPHYLAQQIVDEVIFCVDSSRLSSLEDVFLLCDEEGVRTRVSIDFFPHINSEISLDRVGTAPLLTFSATPTDDLSLVAKRSLDLLLASLGILLLSPLIAVAAILIKLTSAGPVIYRQTRCGLNGRRFTLYKLRSMIDDADRLKPDLAHLSEKSIAFKLADDPRVTPVGHWLRRFSIDEWPQFWNVLRGDMSIVGPRPPLPEEVDRYERWQRRRLRMRPGLTCLWVLNGRDRLSFETWMKMDMAYIDNWSLTLDWSIIFRTIPHVLTGRGAH